MRLWSELSLAAQTAYVQLFDAALAAEYVRGVADLSRFDDSCLTQWFEEKK